jgi:hypothetical protein
VSQGTTKIQGPQRVTLLNPTQRKEGGPAVVKKEGGPGVAPVGPPGETRKEGGRGGEKSRPLNEVESVAKVDLKKG